MLYTLIYKRLCLKTVYYINLCLSTFLSEQTRSKNGIILFIFHVHVPNVWLLSKKQKYKYQEAIPETRKVGIHPACNYQK